MSNCAFFLSLHKNHQKQCLNRLLSVSLWRETQPKKWMQHFLMLFHSITTQRCTHKNKYKCKFKDKGRVETDTKI